MCTIMTLDRDTYKNHAAEVRQQIALDAVTNDDGVSLLLLHANGKVSNYRTMDIDQAQEVLESLPWVRFWLHQRAATGRKIATEYAHGFCADGVWYMHNGIIRNPEADRLPVDSMVIGRWISRNQQYARLATEPFANVFFVAPASNVYTVWRSPSGSLFTDGQGNYSTRKCGPMDAAATQGAASFHLRDPDEVERQQQAEAAELEAARLELRNRYATVLDWREAYKRLGKDDDASLDGVGALWRKYGVD